MKLRLILVLLGFGLVALTSRADADDADPNGTPWITLIPQASGELSYRAYDAIDNTAIPAGDWTVITHVMDDHWEAPLNYILAIASIRLFDFYSKPWDEVANLNFARLHTGDQVLYLCGITEYACSRVLGFYAGGVVEFGVLYGPHIWHHGNPRFEHATAHEIGHSFVLNHHGSCGFVMGPPECTDMPDAGEFVTALEELGY